MLLDCRTHVDRGLAVGFCKTGLVTRRVVAEIATGTTATTAGVLVRILPDRITDAACIASKTFDPATFSSTAVDLSTGATNVAGPFQSTNPSASARVNAGYVEVYPTSAITAQSGTTAIISIPDLQGYSGISTTLSRSILDQLPLARFGSAVERMFAVYVNSDSEFYVSAEDSENAIIFYAIGDGVTASRFSVALTLAIEYIPQNVYLSTTSVDYAVMPYSYLGKFARLLHEGKITEDHLIGKEMSRPPMINVGDMKAGKAQVSQDFIQGPSITRSLKSRNRPRKSGQRKDRKVTKSSSIRK